MDQRRRDRRYTVRAQNRLIPGSAMRIRTSGDGPEGCNRRVGQGCKGFQPLRPEHFLSHVASKTPIMYCKRLLEAEKGKATNVLFSNGHVEPVTARELRRLKDMALPGQGDRE